jgi:hypothetical protein
MRALHTHLSQAQALSDAKATGAYNAKHIFQGKIDQNDATGTYERMHTWMKQNKPRLASLSTPGKANMRLVGVGSCFLVLLGSQVSMPFGLRICCQWVQARLG